MQQHLNEHKRETQIICTAVPLGGTLDCEARLRALTLTETLDTYEAQTISLCLSSVSVHYVHILKPSFSVQWPSMSQNDPAHYDILLHCEVLHSGYQGRRTNAKFPYLENCTNTATPVIQSGVTGFTVFLFIQAILLWESFPQGTQVVIAYFSTWHYY